MDNTHKTTK